MAKSILTSHRTSPIAGQPPVFTSDNDALAWAVRVGAYRDTREAKRAFDALAQRGTARWAHWIGMVASKLATRQ